MRRRPLRARAAGECCSVCVPDPTEAPTPAPTEPEFVKPAPEDPRWTTARKDGRCGKRYGMARCHPTESGHNLPWSRCCNLSTGVCGKTAGHCEGPHGVDFEDVIAATITSPPTPSKFGHAFEVDEDAASPACEGREQLRENAGLQTCAKFCQRREGCTHFSWRAADTTGKRRKGPCFWEKEAGPSCVPAEGVSADDGWRMYKLNNVGSATTLTISAIPAGAVTLSVEDAGSIRVGDRVRIDGTEERTVIAVDLSTDVTAATQHRRRRLATAGTITLDEPLTVDHAAGAFVEVVVDPVLESMEAAAKEAEIEAAVAENAEEEDDDQDAEEDAAEGAVVEDANDGSEDSNTKAFVRKHMVALIGGVGGVAGLAAIVLWARRTNTQRNKTKPALLPIAQLPIAQVVVAVPSERCGGNTSSKISGPRQPAAPAIGPPNACTRGSLERLNTCNDFVREIQEEEAAAFRDLENFHEAERQSMRARVRPARRAGARGAAPRISASTATTTSKTTMRWHRATGWCRLCK